MKLIPYHIKTSLLLLAIIYREKPHEELIVEASLGNIHQVEMKKAEERDTHWDIQQIPYHLSGLTPWGLRED